MCGRAGVEFEGVNVFRCSLASAFCAKLSFLALILIGFGMHCIHIHLQQSGMNKGLCAQVTQVQ